MKTYLIAGGSFGVGVVVGVLAVKTRLEQAYREKSESLERVYQMRNEKIGTIHEVYHTDAGVFVEGEIVDSKRDEPAVDGERIDDVVVTQDEPVKNDYHKAFEAVQTPVEMFVEGGVNDYGVSYIEEEDFEDEDGRVKNRVDLMINDHETIFMMDGVQIADWDNRLGDSILVDFYRLVPPGVEPVLYVRNHRTDEDYEVVRVEP